MLLYPMPPPPCPAPALTLALLERRQLSIHSCISFQGQEALHCRVARVRAPACSAACAQLRHGLCTRLHALHLGSQALKFAPCAACGAGSHTPATAPK